MGTIRHFVPGQPDEDVPVLARWRQPIPAGVVGAYADAYTSPGDLVVLPFCQGAMAVREGSLAPPGHRLRIPSAPEGSAGRRAVAVHYDPALLLPTRVALSRLQRRELDAAVAQLGDSPKAGVPLRHHLNALYSTACPACGMPVPARAYIWQRDDDAPVIRELACPDCGWEGQTTITREDVERAKAAPVPELTRHYLWNRVDPGDDALRPRVERLLGFYPPRSLYALATLTRSIVDRGTSDSELGLRLLLLDCLERCQGLAPAGAAGQTRRPTRFRRPARFVEYNVWQAFEEAASRVSAVLQPERNPTLSLLPGEVIPGRAYLGVGQVRNLPQHVPAQSANLILLSPPPLDPVAWTLSAFWTAWLYGASKATALWPLLRHRAPDAAWYARTLSSSLRTLRSLLTQAGRLVIVTQDAASSHMEALLLAAAQAGLHTEAVLHAGSACRIELSRARPPAPAVPLRQAAVQAARAALQGAGEPLPWETLHAQVYGHLSHTGQLGREPPADASSALAWLTDEIDGALADAPFVYFPDELPPRWWLSEDTVAREPLADRTEAAAVAALEATLGASWHELLVDVYLRLPGSPAPNLDLVEACLQSYARPVAGDLWQIRAEDLLATREAEREELVDILKQLGRRFGYAVTPAPEGYDLSWTQSGQPVALFRIQAHARLSALGSLPPVDVARHLVLPGGRAALVSLKLMRNPVLRETLERGGWHFVKNRHVRQLATQEDVERFGLQTIIGLDPIVEQEEAQIPMF